MKNILVVDDHPSIRQYAILLLKDEFKDVCFHESDGENDALFKISEIEMDAVVLDLDLKEGNGLSLMRRTRERLPSLPIAVNTMYEKWELLQQALDAGANGYVSKRDDPLCLLQAIHNVRNGSPYFSPSIQPLLLLIIQNKKTKNEDDVLNLLSEREREVFNLIGREMTKNEIAVYLNISPRTVETHVERIRHKMKIESGKKLEYFAVKRANQTERPTFERPLEGGTPPNLKP